MSERKRAAMTPARKAAIAAKLKELWADPVYREERARQAGARLDALRDSVGFQLAVNAGLRRARAKFVGERNVMKRPEVRAKITGALNPMQQSAVRTKHLAAVRAYHARRKAEQNDG